MTKARVTAEYEIEAVEYTGMMVRGRGATSPRVRVLVEFDFGTEEQAAERLAEAVEDVRRQIADVAEGRASA